MQGTRNKNQLSPDPQSSTDVRVPAILNYLAAQDLKYIPKPARIAASLNLSPSRLRSIFRDHVGMSLSCYIKFQRMRRARRLLCGTLMTVKEVMVQVGVNDYSHFSRDYKKIFGESPSQTRSAWSQANVAIALLTPQDSQNGHTKEIV